MPDFPLIPALKQISGASPLTGSTGPISFSFDPEQVKTDNTSSSSSNSNSSYYIGWVNQANVINYTPATVDKNGRVESSIPSGMAGLAFAALTGQNTAVDVNALTGVTVAGPAPVQIS